MNISIFVLLSINLIMIVSSYKSFIRFIQKSNKLNNVFQHFSTVQPTIQFKIDHVDGTTHKSYFNNRDWETVESFWQRMVRSKINQLPSFVYGEGDFSINNLDDIHEIGLNSGEFVSDNPEYKKWKVFALRVGYVGTKFHVSYSFTICN